MWSDVQGSQVSGRWYLNPVSVFCRDAVLAGRVAASRQDYYLRGPAPQAWRRTQFYVDNVTRAIE